MLIGLSLSFAHYGICSPATQLRKVSGHVPTAVKARQPLSRLASDKKLNLALGLPLRSRAELEEFLHELYDPSSSKYQRYLTSDQFTERFGPSRQDYQAVIEFARSNHLSITAMHPNRMLLDVSGTVGDIEHAFGVNLMLYSHPAEARNFYAPDAEPLAPAALPLIHISGLNNYLIPHPASLRQRSPRGGPDPVPQIGSGPSGAFRGSDFRGAYARGVSLNGAGQMVGLLEFDGFYALDIAAYANQSSIQVVPVITVTVDGFDGTPGADNVEAALDIEMVTAMAPNLAGIIVYEAGPNGLADDILNRMATDNLAKQLSASWTFAIDPAIEQMFLQFAAQGQSYFNASGDDGAYSGTVTSPADNPNVTVVGGTELSTTGPGGAWVSETTWNRGGSGRNGSTGGGISTTYSIPSWQQEVSMTANGGSASMRNLPDVAAVADGVWVTYNNGSTEIVGGTSCSAPLWAGFTALVNQQAAGFGRPPIGFLNPALYRLGLAAGYTTNFHDITTGNNTNSGSPNLFFAVPGYDLCTGWGSPSGQNLINALAPRLSLPLITNVNFSILSEGCSPPNNTVDPGETVTVNLTLKNVGAIKTTNLVATLLASDNVFGPGEPQTYGVLSGGGAGVSRSFTFTAAGTCGSSLSATLQLQDGASDLGKVAFNIPLGKPLIVVTQNFDNVNIPALPADWTTTTISVSNSVTSWVSSNAGHDSAPNAAFADEPPYPGVEELISPVIPITATNALLSFRQSYNTEVDPTTTDQAFDGGFLEIQIGTNDFTEIVSAGGSFVTGGYNRTISTDTNTDNLFKGRPVWGGNSGGFITTTVQLPAGAAGQTVQFKWRFSIDTGNFYGGAGWFIDNVSVVDGGTCCTSSADLSLAAVSSPEPVPPGQLLNYSITVTNLGPGSAFGVAITNILPEAVVFSSGSPGCAFTNGAVLCDAGTLDVGASTNFSFAVLPTTADAITNTLLLGSFTADPDLSNNQVNTVSTVSTDSPPVVSVSSTNTVAVRGGMALLQATVFGLPPLSYQWFFNGNSIAGATTNALVLTNAQPEQSGAYTLTVTNLNGWSTSPVVKVTVIDAPTILLTPPGTEGTSFSINFPSVTGLTYTLEYKDSLSDSNWTPILPSLSGTGGPLSLVDTNTTSGSSRFYRLSAQ